MSIDASIRAVVGDFELDVDLAVADGEVVGVLGPNGSGKSTLLRVLAGLCPLRDGFVELSGRVVDDPDHRVLVPPERRSCAIVFQEHRLFPHLSAEANVAFGPRCRGVPRRAAEAEAQVWLDRMGVADRRAARPHELSGGEGQRVALARALATRPAVLLLDEPTAALDLAVRGVVREELLHHLRRFEGATVLVTHDPVDAACLADRIVVLDAGRIVQGGPYLDVARRPQSPYVARLTDVNVLRGDGSGTELTLADGTVLTCADHLDGATVVIVPTQGVALHLEAPSGSAQNAWRTRVVSVHPLGDRVRIGLGGPVPIVAEITARSQAELGVRDGTDLWASVKATQLEVAAGTTR
jgi:molybdate transport system ATP-binding protein